MATRRGEHACENSLTLSLSFLLQGEKGSHGPVGLPGPKVSIGAGGVGGLGLQPSAGLSVWGKTRVLGDRPAGFLGWLGQREELRSEPPSPSENEPERVRAHSPGLEPAAPARRAADSYPPSGRYGPTPRVRVGAGLVRVYLFRLLCV